jgi:transposase
VLEAIFFILHAGIQWEHLPKSFPPKSTVHDRRQLWSTNQAFRKLLAAVVRSLAQKGRIDLDQCFVAMPLLRRPKAEAKAWDRPAKARAPSCK